MNVHLLGAGSTGCLLAYHLQEAIDKKQYGNGENVILQLRSSPKSPSQQQKDKVCLTILNNDLSIQGQKDFAFETPEIPTTKDPIDVLFVCTKADQTIAAIKPLLSRLLPSKPLTGSQDHRRRTSTIVLTQNGMGLDEEMVKEFGWDRKDSEEVPFLLSGINRHGAWTKNKFEIVHAGKGTLPFALSPFTEMRLKQKDDKNVIDSIKNSNGEEFTPQLDSLIWTLKLLSTPHMISSMGIKLERQSADLIIQQQQKLVANCVINPLTALHNVRNGECLSDPTLRRWSEQIINECFEIINARLQNQSNGKIPKKLQLDNLKKQVWNVIQKTSNNWSSMVQDIRSKRGTTEIDFINGTIVKWANNLNLQAPINEQLVKLVKEKASSK